MSDLNTNNIIAYTTVDNKVIAVFKNKAVGVSLDRGYTFNLLTTFNELTDSVTLRAVKMFRSSSGRLFIAITDLSGSLTKDLTGLIYYSDNLVDWSCVHVNASVYTGHILNIDEFSNNTLIVTTDEMGNGAQVYSSVDDGTTWTTVSKISKVYKRIMNFNKCIKNNETYFLAGIVTKGQEYKVVLIDKDFNATNVANNITISYSVPIDDSKYLLFNYSIVYLYNITTNSITEYSRIINSNDIYVSGVCRLPSGRIVVAVYSSYANNLAYSGIYYSDDDGLTFIPSNIIGQKTFHNIQQLGDNLLINGPDGMYTSKTGDYWQKVNDVVVSIGNKTVLLPNGTVSNAANEELTSATQVFVFEVHEYLDKRGLATVIEQIKNSSGGAATANEFVGTQAEWDALTTEEQNAYDKAYIKKEAETSNEYIGSEEAWDALTAEEQNAYDKAYFV